MEAAFISIIKKTEERLLSILYNYCRELFTEYYLPSHDHFHHMRVWNYTRELLSSLPMGKCGFTEPDIEQLILAVFFHDTGLTVTLDEDHGLESAKICRKFISANKDLFSAYPAEAIKAIEMHDKKETKTSGSFMKAPGIPVIVSVCDDLDAYGPIGILRYAEIYLLRGVSLDKLPERVLKNMKSRFRLLSGQKWIPGDLFTKHRGRYRYALDFYQKMNNPGNTFCKKAIVTYMDYVYQRKGDLNMYVNEIAGSSDPEALAFGRDLYLDITGAKTNSPSET